MTSSAPVVSALSLAASRSTLERSGVLSRDRLGGRVQRGDFLLWLEKVRSHIGYDPG